MARRYVRDTAGRFASTGGGGKRKGKLSKSTAGRSAKAKYKAATSKVRKKTSGVGINTAKGSKSHKKQVSTAKGQLTRVTNKLAGKGRGSAATKSFARGPKQARGVKKRRGAKTYDNTTNQMFKQRQLKRDLKRKHTGSKAAKRVGAKAKKAAAAKKAVAAKKKTYGGLTPKQQYKAATSKARAAKSGYVQDRGQGYDRAGKASGKGKVKRSMKLATDARGVGAAKGQVTRLGKKFRKGATVGKGYKTSTKGKKARSRSNELKKQRGGATKGRGTVAQRKASLNYRTTNQAFGFTNKRSVSRAAQRYIGKRNVEEMRVSSSRGKGSKARRRLNQIRGRRS